MTLSLHSHSPEETLEIGKTIGSYFRGDEIILLAGGLGSGKTLITKGMAFSMGINPDEVVSPTFTLMNHFQGQRDNRSFNLFHFDCYRLVVSGGEKNPARQKKVFEDLNKIPENGIFLPEVDEYIDEGVIVIEWAQYLHPSYFSLPKSVKVVLQFVDESNRFIRMESLLDYIKKSSFLKYFA